MTPASESNEKDQITRGLGDALGGLIRDQLACIEERHQRALAQAWDNGATASGDAAEQWFYNEGGRDLNPYRVPVLPPEEQGHGRIVLWREGDVDEDGNVRPRYISDPIPSPGEDSLS